MSPAVDPQDHVIGPGRTDGAEIYVSNGTFTRPYPHFSTFTITVRQVFRSLSHLNSSAFAA
jgi:hypothetical protein